MRRLFCLLIILLASELVGCASTTSIRIRYQVAPPSRGIHHLLLAARTTEAGYRKTWENSCKDVFRDVPVQLTLSGKALPGWYDSGVDPLTKWAQAHQADAILVVDITGLLLAPPQVPPADMTGAVPQRGPLEDPIGVPQWSFFIGRKAKRTPEPPLIQVVEAQLVSANGKMLWDGILSTHEANNMEAIATSQCLALRKQLVKEHFLP